MSSNSGGQTSESCSCEVFRPFGSFNFTHKDSIAVDLNAQSIVFGIVIRRRTENTGVTLKHVPRNTTSKTLTPPRDRSMRKKHGRHSYSRLRNVWNTNLHVCGKNSAWCILAQNVCHLCTRETSRLSISSLPPLHLHSVLPSNRKHCVMRLKKADSTTLWSRQQLWPGFHPISSFPTLLSTVSFFFWPGV